MKNIAKLFLMSLKSIKAVFLLTFGIMLVAVPILNYGNYKLLGISDELRTAVIYTARRLIPFACVLPSVLILRQLVEIDGKELMQIYLRGKRVLLTWLAVLLSLLTVSPLFAFYSRFFKGMRFEYAKVMCISILLYGITYFIMSISRSTAITLLALIIYEVFVVADNSKAFANYVLYNENSLNRLNYWFCLVITGIILTVIGERVFISLKKL